MNRPITQNITLTTTGNMNSYTFQISRNQSVSLAPYLQSE